MGERKKIKCSRQYIPYPRRASGRRRANYKFASKTSPNTQYNLVSRCAPSSGIRLARQAEPGSPTFANELEYSPIGKRIILENVRRNIDFVPFLKKGRTTMANEA